MERNSLLRSPEYAFTAREIEMVNAGTLHILEQDWLKKTGNESCAQPPRRVSVEESQRYSIAGSGANEIAEFDHAQEPALTALSEANDYAHGVNRQVNAMYEEAYAANDFPAGPVEYFAEQKGQLEFANSFRGHVTKFLGSLVAR